MELKPDPKEMTKMESALTKAFKAPRGLLSNYLSCLSEQEKSKLMGMHKQHDQYNQSGISLKKFAEKIRKGEYEYRLIVK